MILLCLLSNTIILGGVSSTREVNCDDKFCCYVWLLPII